MKERRLIFREVLVDLMAGWIRVRTSKVIKDGWLHYTLGDGTNGIVRPSRWREVDAIGNEVDR